MSLVLSLDIAHPESASGNWDCFNTEKGNYVEMCD